MEGQEGTTTQQSGSQEMSKGMSVWASPSSESTQQKPAESQQAPAQQTTQESTQARVSPQQPSQAQMEQEAARRGMSVEELAEVIALANEKAEARKAQTQAKAQEGQMSEEQFRKQFGIFQVEPQQFAAMFGLEEATPEQVQAFNMIIQRTASMAVKMAEYKAKQMVESMGKEFAPIKDSVSRMNAKAIESRFANRYPQLTKYEQIVRQVADRVKGEGKKFNTVDEGMAYVAEQATAILKSVGVDVSAQTQASPQQQVRKPAVASMGSSAGTKSSTSSAPKSKGLSVFM